MAHGGRYNHCGESGALYCASDEETAWAEVAARFKREGISGLPSDMGSLRILLIEGRYADLSTEVAAVAWNCDWESLASPEPTEEQQSQCYFVGRAVRAVADFLSAPAARANGFNVPLFHDRENSELSMELHAAGPSEVPRHLRQKAKRLW